MNARDELVEQLSIALSDIEQLQPCTDTALDAELLGAVADYIESGVNAEATLKRLRGTLAQVAKKGSVPQAPVQVKKESEGEEKEMNGNGAVSAPVLTAEELGRQRAQLILRDILKERYARH
ncbi:uncharacterized protein TEOVI_000466300 [Trypanosoma equiperdum]|uniref:Uncharacterized protein n=2 Tax=Trypanozoon TaxID=39700 RepID=Q583X3_TRYB2|nr:hypothetical protein, conserved [Trypanosoma brucei brucei TREU927]AAX79826.1 hypothetical protein, conserved [Trypanosoma brucei]AAZ10887.1 hypothetical protein, conserved [Trypanosoma brucei brucei TREU927]SCU67076.1 hypothetical protein, conserved [Trypanosoma equiperdum]